MPVAATFQVFGEQNRKQPGADIIRDRQTATAVIRQPERALREDQRVRRTVTKPGGKTKERLVVGVYELFDGGRIGCSHRHR